MPSHLTTIRECDFPSVLIINVIAARGRTDIFLTGFPCRFFCKLKYNIVPQFFVLLKRFVGAYKGYVTLNILCNILSTVFSVFSFALIIPILEILFKTTSEVYSYQPFAWNLNVMKNNAYWWVSNYIEQNGGVHFVDFGCPVGGDDIL